MRNSESPRGRSRGNGNASQSAEIQDRQENDRALRISQILCYVIDRRDRGESISYSEVIDANPDLMPALGEELAGLDVLHRTMLLADKNSPRSVADNNHSEGSSTEPPRTKFQIKDNPVRKPQIRGYLIEREISSGGQATVFQAVQERTKRTVAVKVFFGGAFLGSHGHKRFERESEILARLQHPNIVGIIDCGRTEDGSLFLVTDFIDGTNLDDYVKSLGKDHRAIISIFITIARAVDEAHKQGVVHRDLNPMNVVVDRRGDPHVLDFGMARLLPDFDGKAEGVGRTILTRTGYSVGSLPWSSPEQFIGRHESVDARSDIYALGVMLFLALAGKSPSPEITIQYLTTARGPALAPIAKRNGLTIPKGVDKVIQKATAKSPDDRYSSILTFAADLQSCLDGKPPVIPKRSSRTRSFLFLAALLPLIASIPFLFHRKNFEPPTFVNLENMRLVKISAGKVVPSAFNNTHAVATSIDHDFYLSDTDVTQEQYQRVVGYHPQQSPYQRGLPVHEVTLGEANQFCRLLSIRDHRQYRLPTAEEWKYAFSGGEVQRLTAANLPEKAWCAENSERRPHPVATKAADRRGLYDMLGNVRQWCSGPNDSASLAPVEGTDYLTPAAGCLDPPTLESSCPITTASATIGFRIACDSAGQH